MRLPGPLTADQERHLKTVRSSAGHLLALINDLLDLAKIDAGKVELASETTDCGGVLAEVASELQPLAEAKGLAMRVATPHGDVAILADRRALKQILLNLANNAIKFSDVGVVELRLEKSVDADSPRVEISVTDNGKGIRQEAQASLFEAFARLGEPGEGHREGTGLGLYLSQKLAQLMGGSIVCRSEYGRGSRFTLSLPDR
jgi:two-component system sensor histidine kinase/response regulator